MTDNPNIKLASMQILLKDWTVVTVTVPIDVQTTEIRQIRTVSETGVETYYDESEEL